MVGRTTLLMNFFSSGKRHRLGRPTPRPANSLSQPAGRPADLSVKAVSWPDDLSGQQRFRPDETEKCPDKLAIPRSVDIARDFANIRLAGGRTPPPAS